MAVPIATAFPAPTGGFPLSPVAADPSFGSNPFGTTNMYLQGAFQQNTAALLQRRQLQQQALMQAAQFAATNGALGGTLDSNPTQWTPEEAAQQTDRALAKLSTVNPELAQQLAAQRTGGDSGGGFFDSLKHVAGDLLHPALSFFGTVFDYVGRTAHIVPNIAFDMADGGGFDPAHDIGGALTGEVAHGWHNVIDEVMGHKTGVWGAVLGLGLDIGTDPITYLWPAGAGAKLAETTEQAARIAATRGVAKSVVGMTTEELTGKGLGSIAAEVAGRSEEEVTSLLETHWDQLTRDMADAGFQAGMTGGEMQEKAAAAVNNLYKDGELSLYQRMWEVGDNTARLVRTRGWRTAKRLDLTLSDGLGITARDTSSMFEQVVKDGNWKFGPRSAEAGTAAAINREAWETGRSFASLAGGARFKLAVPYTSFRYISSPLFDMSRLMPHAAGQAAMRFFAGQSGMVNLLHYVHNGDLGMDALRDWMNMGYKEWAEVYPEAARTLTTRTGRLGSMLYSASDRVGGLTTVFDKGSRASRAGLVSQLGYRDAKEAEEKGASLVRDLMHKVVGDDQQLTPLYDEHFGPAITPETGRGISKYLSYFPVGRDASGNFVPLVDTASDTAIDGWYRSIHPEFEALDAEAIASQGALRPAEEEALARHYRILEDMKVTAKGPSEGVAWTDAQKQVMQTHGARFNVAREEVTRHGGSIGLTTQRLEEARELPLDQAGDWRSELGRNDALAEETWYTTPVDAGARQELRHGLGVGTNQVGFHDEFHSAGVEVHTTPRPGDVPVHVRARLGTPIELDATGDALLPGGLVTDNLSEAADRTVLGVREEVARVMRETAEQADSANTILEPVSTESINRSTLTAMTDAMKAGRQGANMVYRRDAEGGLRAVVWDPGDVKAVGEELVPTVEGYYPRYINRETSRWVNGVVPKDEGQVLLSEPQIKAEIERRTRGMTMDEANAQARAILREKYPRADIDTLPDWLFITDPREADKVYLDRAVQDIKDQVLGRSADRMRRLGRIAPFMFTAEPRSQQFELNVTKGWMKALEQSGRDVAGSALRLKKHEAALLEKQHSVAGRLAEGFGHLSMLMDEGTLPDRVSELEARYGGTVEKAREYLATGRAHLDGRRSYIAKEQEAYDAAREAAVPSLGKATPEQVEAIDAALKDATDVAADPERIGVLSDDVENLKAKIATLEEEIEAGAEADPQAAKLKEATLEAARRDLAAHEGLNWRVPPSLKASDPAAEELGHGVYVRRSPQAVLGNARELYAEAGIARPEKRAYFVVDEEGKTVGFRTVAADGRVSTEVSPLERRKGYATRMLQAHWRDEGVYEGSIEQRLAKARSLIERQSFSKEGSGLNVAELKRMAEEAKASGGDGAAVFEREVENGNIYLNRNTGSVFTREGNLVAKGGGVQLRPQYARDLELEDLRSQAEELDQAAKALDERRAYEAPAEAQPGERAAGVHRSVQDRATYKTQQAGERYALAARGHGKVSAEAVQAGKVMGRLRSRLNDVMNTLNKAYAEAHGIKAEMKVAFQKVETAGDLGGLTRLRVPGLEGYAMPSLIAEEWHSVIDKFGPGDLSKAWRNFVLGPWKRWATYRNPGFHVRNFYGAWFDNWLGGVREFHFNFSMRVNRGLEQAVSEPEFRAMHLGRLFGDDSLGKLTYADVKEHLSSLNIGTANSRSVLEAADTVETFREGLNLVDKNFKRARKAFGAVDSKLRDVGGGVESFHRVAAWSRGMEVTQGDTWGARAFTMMRHGDYAELTNAEDHIRDIIPFYKWLRTNTPYQIRMLAENPGQLALVARAREFAYDVQGLDKQAAETQQPDFMRQTLSIPLPSWLPFIGSKDPDHLKYAMLDMPYNDLYNGLNDYLSAGLPVVRNLIESYGFHEQAFTGKPLAGRMVPLSGLFNTPGIRDILAAVGVAHKGADGGVYINDRVENVLTAWPVYSRFRNFVEADPDRVQQRLSGLLSFVSGVSVREADATQAELDFYYNELEPLLQQYRDMGVTFPDSQDFVSAAEALSPTLPAANFPASGVLSATV